MDRWWTSSTLDRQRSVHLNVFLECSLSASRRRVYVEFYAGKYLPWSRVIAVSRSAWLGRVSVLYRASSEKALSSCCCFDTEADRCNWTAHQLARLLMLSAVNERYFCITDPPLRYFIDFCEPLQQKKNNLHVHCKFLLPVSDIISTDLSSHSCTVFVTHCHTVVKAKQVATMHAITTFPSAEVNNSPALISDAWTSNINLLSRFSQQRVERDSSRISF